LSDQELIENIRAARKLSKILEETEPRAKSARYDPDTGRIEIELKDGCLFAFPTGIAQGLRGASAAQLAAVEVWGDGYALHWEELDADFTVPGLVAGRFGTKRWMSELGRRGGSAKSEAKARASRENGKKGGRPRKAAG
jgi:hypothetical protein